MNTERKNYINSPTCVAVEISKQYRKNQFNKFQLFRNKFCWVQGITFFSVKKYFQGISIQSGIIGYTLNVVL